MGVSYVDIQTLPIVLACAVAVAIGGITGSLLTLFLGLPRRAAALPAGGPGWYGQPDGSRRYWDGRLWVEDLPPTYGHRQRSHRES